MKFHKVKDGYLLRINKDEELVGTLTQFAIDNEIMSGFLHGLGGVQQATIGFYELEEQQYHFKTFNNLVEIVSLNGNFALRNGKPFLHLHGTFSDRELNVIGGHVKSATIAGTCEIYLTTFTESLNRTYNEDVGLDLFDL